MNNSYLNILLIYAPLRYGSEFWLWQILNRKIFFLNVIITDLLLTTNVSRWVNLEAWSNTHIFVLKKKSKIDPFLRNRKNWIFDIEFFELRRLRGRNGINEVGTTYHLEIFQSESSKLESTEPSWNRSLEIGKIFWIWKVSPKLGRFQWSWCALSFQLQSTLPT